MNANSKRAANHIGKPGKVRKSQSNAAVAQGAVEERHITERKRAEEELRKLRTAVVASGEVIFMADRDGLFTFVNPEFTRLYGYTAAEVVGKATPRILKSGVMKPEDYGIFWQNLLNKQVVKAELINKTKDGRLVTVGVSVNPILDDDGNTTGFLAIQRDITERKRSEEALRESEERFTAFMDNSPIVAWLKDPATWTYRYINHAFEEVFGITREVITKKTILICGRRRLQDNCVKMI